MKKDSKLLSSEPYELKYVKKMAHIYLKRNEKELSGARAKIKVNALRRLCKGIIKFTKVKGGVK